MLVQDDHTAILSCFRRDVVLIRNLDTTATQGHLQFFNKEILPLIQSRTSQLNSEFKFLPAMGPQERGGVYELRTYDLKPGSLLEWEESWRVGLEARIKAGHSPAGAWFRCAPATKPLSLTACGR